MTIRNALVSVYDKAGLEPLCRALTKHGITLYSTGGTASFIEQKLGIAVRSVESVTRFPEMMDGRVKTLHPKIFGGILARRDQPKDQQEAAHHEIPLFDLVVVNLYPFWDHRGEDRDQQAKFVDIGGPAMIRAAAKNFAAVTVLSDPADYAPFIGALEQGGGSLDAGMRQRFASLAFQRTSQYDSLIAAEWSRDELPTCIPLSPQRPLRYGENPHQRAAWCGTPRWRVLQGRELSYNNLLDSDAALRLAYELKRPAVAIVKHNNPCGVAAGDGPLAELFARALQADSQSAFGGIVATNRSLDAETAQAMSQIFLEVILVRSFDPAAAQILARKKNLRLIEWEKPSFNALEVRGALGGWLLQDADGAGAPAELKTVTKAPVPAVAWLDLEFAWLVCKHVRSNAIVIAKDGTTLGIGAGQMSRVDAVEIALKKCPRESCRGAVLASDAFFPFRDNIDRMGDLGISAVIQPGGSQRDPEVIQACDERGIAMVFTGERHFRH